MEKIKHMTREELFEALQKDARCGRVLRGEGTVVKEYYTNAENLSSLALFLKDRSLKSWYYFMSATHDRMPWDAEDLGLEGQEPDRLTVQCIDLPKEIIEMAGEYLAAEK